MARVTTYTCDRCNKEIQESAGSLPVITLKNHDGDAIVHHAGIVDVCQKCIDIAANYIRRAYKMPVVETTKTTKNDEKEIVDSTDDAESEAA